MVGAIANAWRSLVVRGVLVLFLGAAALAFPSETIYIVGAFAVFALVHGIIDVVVALRNPGNAAHAGIVFAEGAIWIVGGFATFHWLASAFTLGYVIAFWSLGLGIVMMILALATREHFPSYWLLGLFGAGGVGFGIWLLHDPAHLFLIGPAVELAALAFVTGAALIVFGLQGRHVQKTHASAHADELVGLKRET